MSLEGEHLGLAPHTSRSLVILGNISYLEYAFLAVNWR